MPRGRVQHFQSMPARTGGLDQSVIRYVWENDKVGPMHPAPEGSSQGRTAGGEV